MTEDKHKQRLFELAFGHMATQAVATAVRLGMADALGDGERASADLAAEFATDPAATRQLCSALAALGILDQTGSDLFRLTETGALLQTDRPDSLSSFTRVFTDPAIQSAWRELDSAVRTGGATFGEVFGKSFFEYVAGDAELSKHFPVALQQSAMQTARALPGHYRFADFGTVADVGGGSGAVLAAVLAANPGLQGILYDTAAATSRAAATMDAADVADRCTVVVGDAADAAPEGADLYLMKNVVHHADDDRAGAVLGNIRKVIPPHGRLLIVDPAMPDTVDGTIPDTMYLSDLQTRIINGGRGRTLGEYTALCELGGFAVREVSLLPAPMAFSLIEAAPV